MAARKALPFFNGTMPSELQINGGSASVKWRRLENLAVASTPLAEVTGTAAAFLGRNTVQPTITDVTVAVQKYGNAILTTEEMDFFNINTDTARMVDMMGANAGESLNTAMISVFQAATNIRRANNVATDLTIITAMSSGDIRFAHNLLKRNSAQQFSPAGTGSINIGTSPIRTSYYGICHPDVEEDIRLLSGFVAVEQYQGYTEVEPYEFGFVNGVRWSSSELAGLIAVAGATSAAAGFRPTGTQPNDVYSSFVYGKNAIGSVGLGNMHAKSSYEMYDPKKPPAVELIYKKRGEVGTDLYNEVSSLSWKSWFAGKILNDAWVVHVKTLATRL
jgi:N4-gp56 family major capsid protein